MMFNVLLWWDSTLMVQMFKIIIHTISKILTGTNLDPKCSDTLLSFQSKLEISFEDQGDANLLALMSRACVSWFFMSSSLGDQAGRFPDTRVWSLVSGEVYWAVHGEIFLKMKSNCFQIEKLKISWMK